MVSRDTHVSLASWIMYITLQDVAIQLGLPINGNALTGSLNYSWVDLPWLSEEFNNFAHLEEDVDEKEL